MRTPFAPDVPVWIRAAVGVAVLGGLVNFIDAVVVAVDDGLTGRMLLGLLTVLIISLVPAGLAVFTARGYLLAYVILIASSLLTILREIPVVPAFPAIALLPISVITLVCLGMPESVRWMRAQQPQRG